MRYKFSCRLVWFAGLAILGAGCNALHVPQSEIMLFEKHEDSEEALNGISASSSQLRSGFREYALDQSPRTRRVWVLDRNLWSLAYKRGFNAERLGAIGLAMNGSGLGLDWTYSFRKLYITAMGNTQRNYAVFLQYPVVRHYAGGLGVGVYYRNERHGITRCEDTFICYTGEPDISFRISSMGIRIAHYINDDRSRLRSRLWLGYSPEMEAVVFSVGLGIPISP